MKIKDVKSPADIKQLGDIEMAELSADIRRTILDTVSKNGGHLASNLGVVELTLALHRVFDCPNDRFIFDVGHQCYAHKLLTGRYDDFSTLRKSGGISGFPRSEESDCDFFGSAHSSNSISVAVGMATADKLSGTDSTTVAIIGDGSFTGGMAYEALNNCVDKDLKLIIVLNDNEMSISRNVGAIDNYFSRFRASKQYFNFKNRFVGVLRKKPLKWLYKLFRLIKNKLKRLVLKENFFELLDLEYYGPIDGNNEKQLETVFRELKNNAGGIAVVHIYTKKGLGYPFAEKNPSIYHSVGKFDLEKGVSAEANTSTFSYNAGRAITELARKDNSVCAVTAAMTAGTGLDCFKKEFEDRFFDVGIAEQHAVTFCAGLSSGGKTPIFAVYSTFMQRAFDQLLMDVSLQNFQTVLAIDRAGLVGDDGPTHHGVFDVALLSAVPNALVFSPASISELTYCFEKAASHRGVSAVRYPRGAESDYDKDGYINENGIFYKDFGTPECAIITYGRLTAECDRAARMCKKGVRVIRLLQIIPADIKGVLKLVLGMKTVLIAEEGIKNGGVGEKLLPYIAKLLPSAHVTVKAIEGFVPHGSLGYLYDVIGISAEKLLVELEND